MFTRTTARKAEKLDKLGVLNFCWDFQIDNQSTCLRRNPEVNTSVDKKMSSIPVNNNSVYGLNGNDRNAIYNACIAFLYLSHI